MKGNRLLVAKSWGSWSGSFSPFYLIRASYSTSVQSREGSLAATQNYVAEKFGFPTQDGYHLPESSKRFADGGQYRIEIPSTESPKAFRALLKTAKELKVPVHRVSQGSGIMLLTDEEIKEMLQIGRDSNVEVCLFVGPRSSWDIGSQTLSAAGKAIAPTHRGMDQILYAMEDVKRGVDLGLKSFLVGDMGLLWLIQEMKKDKRLPEDLICKTSVQMCAANPISARLLQTHGATTFNPPVDLTLPQLSSIRQAIDIPMDVYVEVPDNFGGHIRHYEVPTMIKILSPMYVKLGLRNSPDIYPSGTHIDSTAIALSCERVRRARLVLDMIDRYYPSAKMSPVAL